MDLVTIVAAAEHAASHETSKTPFLVIGGLLAAFAVLAGGLGIMRPGLSERASRTVAGAGALLVVATVGAMLAVS